jgi:hypothetical protein
MPGIKSSQPASSKTNWAILINKEQNKNILHTQTEKGIKNKRQIIWKYSLPMTSIIVQESALSGSQ